MFFTDKTFFEVDIEGQPELAFSYKFADGGEKMLMSTIKPNCYEIWLRYTAEEYIY